MNEKPLIALVKYRIRTLGLSAYARSLGVTRQYLNDVNHDRRGIGTKLARSLGYRVVMKTTRTYEKLESR